MKPIDKLVEAMKAYYPQSLNSKRILQKMKAYAKKKHIDTTELTRRIAETHNYNATTALVYSVLCEDTQLAIDRSLYYDIVSNFYINCDSIKDLLAKGANPNRVFDGHNALYIATKNKRLPAIKTLLDAGADPYSGELVAQGDRVYHINALNLAATISEANHNFDLFLEFLKSGYASSSILVSTTNGSIFNESSTVYKMNNLYLNPEKFLSLSDDDVLSDNLPYFKQATMYGLQAEAKNLKDKNQLTNEYLTKCKELVREIGIKIENAKEKRANEIDRIQKAIQKEHENAGKIRAEQEKLFAGVVNLTKNLKTDNPSNVAQIGVKLKGNKNVAKAVNDAQKVEEKML